MVSFLLKNLFEISKGSYLKIRTLKYNFLFSKIMTGSHDNKDNFFVAFLKVRINTLKSI